MQSSKWLLAAREVFHPAAPADVFSLIDRAFRGRADDPCLTDASDPDNIRTHSWRSVRGRAAQIANTYASFGLKKGDGVFFLTRKSVSTVEAHLASLMGGTVSVPGQVISKNPTGLQIRAIIDDIVLKRNTLVRAGILKDGGLLIIDPDIRPYLNLETQRLFKNVLTLGDEGEGTLSNMASWQEKRFKRPVLGPRDKTFSLFTSGSSSGEPKGVVYTQQMTATNLWILKDWLRIGPKTRALNALPINHLHGLMQQLFAVLAGGGHVLLTETFNAKRFIRLMQKSDIVSGVPAIWHQVLDVLEKMDPREVTAKCSRPYVFTAGSDRVDEALRERFFEITGRKLTVRGGSTEMQHAYGNFIDLPDMGEVVGLPFGSYEITIRDPENFSREVPLGGVGELCMRGPCVVEEYVGNPEATKTAFMPGGWYRSGDGVRIDPTTGKLVFVDRFSDFIKSGGERFSPSEVSAFLNNMPQVAQLQIIGPFDYKLVKNGFMDRHEDKGFGQRVTAVIVPKADARIEEITANFLEACKPIPHAHLRPRVLVIAGRLPTSGPGKINRRLTREALENQGSLPSQIDMWSVTYGSKPPALVEPVIHGPG